MAMTTSLISDTMTREQESKILEQAEQILNLSIIRVVYDEIYTISDKNAANFIINIYPKTGQMKVIKPKNEIR